MPVFGRACDTGENRNRKKVAGCRKRARAEIQNRRCINHFVKLEADDHDEKWSTDVSIGIVKWGRDDGVSDASGRVAFGEKEDAMRVLQILHDNERGGVVTLACMIEEGLARRGIQVENAYLYPRSGLGPLRKLVCAVSMMNRILRGNFDALVAYQATASILVGVAGRLRGCQLRIVHQTCTPDEMAYPVRLADKLAGSLGLYTVNIANSVFTRSEFADYPQRYWRSMVLIEHGLDVPVAVHSPDETRRRFGLPAERPLLLNVGRLVAQKNQHVLIRALTQLPDCHLAVAGAGPNRDAYRALAVSLGISDRVHLLGGLSSSDVADLYKASDLFVFPSVWETFGLAAVEAAMMRLPMVVADLAVLREVLAAPPWQPAAFVAPGDVAGWISAIGEALRNKHAPAVLQSYAEVISQKYSRERMISAYLKLLRRHEACPVAEVLGEKISA